MTVRPVPNTGQVLAYLPWEHPAVLSEPAFIAPGRRGVPVPVDARTDQDQLAAALGFTSQAVTRYRRLVDAFTQRAQAEPDRADYQRDLSISYQRLGLCFAELGNSEQAAASLERHLQVALDVYQRSPGQVDAVVDLAIALHLTADPDGDGDKRNQQSRDLLEILEADQRLPSHGKELLDNLRDQDSPPRQET